jgi:hypothetical protein
MSTLKDELMSAEPYRYEYDSVMSDYVFKKGNRVLFRATSLAVYYSEDTQMLGTPGQPAYTLLKHGDSEHVLEHARKNSIISTSGYLGRFIQEQLNRSNPYRLDLEPRWLREARKRKIKFVISVDAHSMNALHNVQYGVGIARRGWVTKKEVLNALGVRAFQKAVRPV